ncbi:PadR family transcriptional regulator [Thermoproteus tenax]|uniref:Predicted transcriptional regulator, PadR family n=1 Tax=Thermoproteus tenax (strain ATCC 35583 / DSM 2078 / JCM 9277 / NBRC 100435 / Kra 1) TaxID=768679 RepID=G4RNZ6_THETK|nr:PadR family transcriptional regulator [Thermoproteus tenax]CCC81290.1 predicted transcriptional regulator, PadR family [Thermoproteus tenax Kra 1]
MFGGRGRGYYKAIVLYLLSSGPLSGYEIIKAIENAFKGKVKPSPGTIYPLLKYLEEEGYITSEEQPVGRKRKKIYRLNEKGKELLAQYSNDPDFVQLMAYFKEGGTAQLDIISSIIEEVRFLSEIFDELETHDRARLQELHATVAEFLEKIARRLAS